MPSTVHRFSALKFTAARLDITYYLCLTEKELRVKDLKYVAPVAEISMLICLVPKLQLS